MKITIIGAGYVGLVSGACLASFGHTVVCVDIDEEKTKFLQEGNCPIYEPGLPDLLQDGLKRDRLRFTTSLEEAVNHAEVIFISVGTPSSRRGNGYADTSFVQEAARSLAPYLRPETIVVNKSTVPVGTTRDIARIIRQTNPKIDFDVAANPEFLREGAAVNDFMRPDRIIIGADSQRAQDILKQIYRPLYLIETPFVITSPETAELIKYATNAFLATKISFINEMANLCETVGGDIRDLAKGIGLDKRIGPKFLHAGPGFGGSCLPKDTLALIRLAQEHGSPTRIVETVVEVNNAQRSRIIRKIDQALGGDLSKKTLAVLGLTFKPETDDLRESAALTILPPLLDRGLKVRAHDPVGMEGARSLLPSLDYVADLYEACEGVDAVCLMTEWNLYRALDLKRIQQSMKGSTFIDLRNVYSSDVMKATGLRYVSVGRPSNS